MNAIIQSIVLHQAVIGQDFLRHLELVLGSTVLGTVVAFPLGVYLSRHRKIAEPVIAVTGMLQTIPSLALLALVLPVLGIGLRPAVVALGVYALLPILRNTYVGLRSVDPAAEDCAVAMGMNPLQKLLRIDLPLALPAILAGVRLSAVYAVSWAVLASLIGAGGLGDLIFEGLATYDFGLLLGGAIPAALIAIAIGYGFTLLDRWWTPKGLRLRAGEESA